MNKIQIIILIFISFSFWGFNLAENDITVPKSLKGTNWNSQFHHYCNFYHFETDSTGYSIDGQVAWSTPIDTINDGISKNKVVYDDPVSFRYVIQDSSLIINYQVTGSNDGQNQRIFNFRIEHKDWLSEYEYAYGRECMREGEKIEEFKQ